MSSGTVERLFEELARVLLPLRTVSGDAIAARRLLGALGWELPPAVSDLGLTDLDLTPTVEALVTAIEVGKEEDDGEARVAYLQLGARATELVAAIVDVASRLSQVAGVTSDFLQKTRIVDELPRRILDYLIVRYVEDTRPVLSAVLQLLGVFDLRYYPADAASYGSEHVRHVLDTDALGGVVSAPDQILERTYDWGSSAPKLGLLMARLGHVLQALGAESAVYKVRRKLEEQLLGRPVPESVAEPMPEMRVTLLRGGVADEVAVGLSLLGLRASSAGAGDAGLALIPFLRGSSTLALPMATGWQLELDSSLEVEGGVAALFRPGTAPQLSANLFGPASTLAASGHLLLRLARERQDGEPFALLSVADVARLEAHRFAVGAGARLLAENQFELIVEGSLTGGRFVLDTTGTDSFISAILPSEGFALEFDIGFSWSQSEGLRLDGSGTLEITIPVHRSLGPISVESIGVVIGLVAGQFRLAVGVSFNADLGPLAASVERIGAAGNVSFPASRDGNLGVADLSLGLLPPTGAGLSLDAGSLTGGGFLEFDTVNERYAGVLELRFGEIGITAIGLITTRMPDGSRGFSMLISIGVTFDPPIQLSFGFVLSGVGGLIGINRTMMLDALREGVRTGMVDSILFPSDPVANATQIISDMRSVFPPAEGRFVIGPMIRLGWGSPPIITAEIGLIIELPDPVRVALLGQLFTRLPTEDSPIVVINLDVLGTVDFGKQKLSIDASLFDSRIVEFKLTGDSALRLSWGNRPEFAMSMGGFHPKFTPPANFPPLRRMGLSLSSGNDFRLTCESYFAVTPNSLQFGARVDLYAAAAGATLEGDLGFDALFYFSPFTFEVEVSGDVAARYQGIDVASVRVIFVLSGPTPWHAHGRAEVSVACFSVTARFSKTWGSRDSASLPRIDPLPELLDALAQTGSWGSKLPPARLMVTSLSATDEENKNVDKPLVVHPAGSLEVRQTRMPLGLRLDKLGNSPIETHHTLTIDSVTAGAQNPQSVPTTEVEEYFARGQYEELAKGRVFSVPSFEQMTAGVLAQTDEATLEGSVEPYALRYESILIDDNGQASGPQLGELEWDKAAPMLKGSVAGLARARRAGLRKFEVSRRRPKVALASEVYVAVDASTLRTVEVGAVGRGRAMMDQKMATHQALHPETAGKLRVVPSYEVVD